MGKLDSGKKHEENVLTHLTSNELEDWCDNELRNLMTELNSQKNLEEFLYG